MASIPNLNTLRTGRSGPRHRGRRGGANFSSPANNEAVWNDTNAETARDQVIQQTDHDASSSRMSAVSLGYLDDEFAKSFLPPDQPIAKRYPIINRGTYVRTKAIDQLVVRFLSTEPGTRKQIISLGAGSDTRFLRLLCQGDFANCSNLEYHELDFESNVNRKRSILRNDPRLSTLLQQAEKSQVNYHLQALDLRHLTAKSPPVIPNLDGGSPTLLLSECCLCYLPPETTVSILQYFTMHISAPLALVLYEPIRPFDAFGKTMVSNLASRGIHLQTLKRYSSLAAQRQRLRVSGFDGGQGARDVHQLWESEEWVAARERERIEKLEWLDEVEEWKLLASHYCVCWGWRGAIFGEAWHGLDGNMTKEEMKDDEIG